MRGEFNMNTFLKKLTSTAGFAVATCLSTTALASDIQPHSVAVQTEVQTDDIAAMTDIAYEAALINAATKTLDEKRDWFAVSFRDAQTQTVRRNVNNSAESRYLDTEDGERIELEIPEDDVVVHVQKIDFEMGTGPKPDIENSFLAKELILPES